jgi:hypothetical protein
MDAVSPLAASRHVMARAALTNFYPTYDGQNDQVDRVSPVRRAVFQRVIPRYRLSTSETRDEGVGPAFISIDRKTEAPEAIRPKGTQEAFRPAPLPHGSGSLVDQFA